MKKWWMILFLFSTGCAEPLETDADTDTGPDTETLERCGEGAEVGLEVGMCAPEFTMPDSEGVPSNLSSFRGQVVLVDLAALW